jgi:hypothetical protein
MFNLGIVDEEEEIMKFQEGDTFVDQGIIYSVEKMEDGSSHAEGHFCGYGDIGYHVITHEEYGHEVEIEIGRMTS